MKLELNCWKEHEDGSVTLIVETDDEGKDLLFRTALKTLFLQAIEYSKEWKAEDDSGAGVGNPERGGADSKDGSGEQPRQPEQLSLF